MRRTFMLCFAALLSGAAGCIFYPISNLNIDPASFDFGSATIGSSSGTQTFTVTNVGGTDSGAVTIAVSGGNAAEFQITSNSCGGVMAPGTVCSVAVAFAPQAAGRRSAWLDAWESGGAVSSARLQGTGI